jgi:RsiW-degrading membrane proteinase PrsW (M82 family)
MGLASGAGFGVSEGISYASHYYNGISGGNIYVIRFVSCVALHSIWSAAAGIAVWKRQFSIQGNMGFLDMLLPLIVILGVPMVLHGLYDTLLKQEMQGLALLTAFASMAWLAWQIEQAKQIQNHPDYQMTTPPSLRI